MAAMKWFDLASQGFYVGAEVLRDGVPRLMLLDVDDKADPSKLLAIGFKRMSGSPAYERGLYYLDAEKLKIGRDALRVALGLQEVPLIEKDRAQISAEFRSAFKAKVGQNLTTAINQARRLGYNKEGDVVYQSPTGRFVQRLAPTGQTRLVAEASGQGAALGGGAFLYADDAQGLADCADGFFQAIRAGSRMDWKDLERYTGAAYARHLMDGEVSDAQLRTFQEAVEAAGYRFFFQQQHDSIDRAVFDEALEAYNGLPVARMRTGESIALQQYSTPLPMGVIAQRLLVGNDALGARTVMEPTAGNGGLLTMLNRRANSFAIELDGKRAGALQRSGIDTFVGDAVNLDYRKTWNQPEGFDYTITNPPFGKMDQPRRFDLLPRVERVDYYIALKTLEARKPEGRSVLILGGDDMRNAGAVRGGTVHFMQYVYDTYNVLGAVELDGRMYSKQGAGANVRMFVVGERREARITAEIPERFEVLRTYDEAWAWSEAVLATYPRADATVEVVQSEVEPEPALQGEPESTVEQAPIGAAPDAPTPPAVKPVAKVERRTNEYQAPYQSASKIAPPTGMVPINMASATYNALAALEERVGPIDDYVATKLRYRPEQLASFFSPEQVDALGLAISKVDGNRGFTNSDMTGFGKGRFAAAMLRYAKLEGKVPVFLTIKPELFTDIFRDLSDIGSGELFEKPFIMNDGVAIMRFGSASDVMHPATSPGERKAALESGTLPEGCDIVLSSYSQFQRRPEINRKSQFLVDIARQGTAFVVDESHVAAGESNISVAIGAALKSADSVVFASATPFKGVANFHIYGKVFPSSVDLVNLPETLKQGGESLMEAISANMARDGVFVRREQDLSKLEFVSREPSEEQRLFNREANDKVAVILRRMAYLAGDVGKEVGEINAGLKKAWDAIPESERSGKRLQASSMNFGSRLYNISRQFLLSLVVDSAADAAIEALEQGRKPVIAVENTGESLLREVVVRKAGVQEAMDELDQLKSDPSLDKDAMAAKVKELQTTIAAALSGVKLEKPPQFRDLMEVMLDRVGVIKKPLRYGVYETVRPSSEEYLEEERAIRALIQELPDLPLSPLDVINQRLRDHGYEPTEVSGRSTSLRRDEATGEWVLSDHKKANAVANVAGYQNGKFDCITITRAGSTGISLHATNRFADSDIRQRDFIVAQKAANIAEFMQWMGRVNRRDQVNDPRMTSIETALPAEARLTMMHNAKLRRLSANTTSNRDNANAAGESMDLLNDVGDTIALEWLTENPRIARELDIELPDGAREDGPNSREQEAPYINKLMGRLLMLESARQDEVLSILTARFAEKVAQLEALGINPFKVDVYDWQAKVAHEEELVSPTLHLTDSAFDDPVKLVKLHFEEDVIPIRQDRLMARIKDGWEGYQLSDSEDRERFRDVLGRAAEAFIAKQLPDVLREKFEKNELALVDALTHESAGHAQRADARMRFLLENWKYMVPGVAVDYTDVFKGEMRGYVTDVRLPSKRDELTLLGAYEMSVAFPGESKTRRISLATLLSQEHPLMGTRHYSIDPRPDARQPAEWVKREITKVMDEFDAAEAGRVQRAVNVLSGNAFRAVEMAALNNLGKPILYTDENGHRQRAVLVKSHINAEKIKSMPLPMDGADVVEYMKVAEPRHQPSSKALYAVTRLFNNALREGVEDGEPEIKRVGQGTYSLVVPGVKKVAGALMADGRIFDLGAKSAGDSLRLTLTGSRKSMSASFDQSMLPEVLTRLQGGGHFGKFYVENLDLEVVKELQARNRVAAQLRSQAAQQSAAAAPN